MSAPQGKPPKRVLIVEDNPLNMKLFTAMLAAQGHQVLQAINGPEGLESARTLLPDLIIMDIQLPGLSGLEVTKSLKGEDATRSIKIVATTAFALSGDEDTIMKSGCDAYMAKPIAISQFIELIESLLAPTGQSATSQAAAPA